MMTNLNVTQHTNSTSWSWRAQHTRLQSDRTTSTGGDVLKIGQRSEKAGQSRIKWIGRNGEVPDSKQDQHGIATAADTEPSQRVVPNPNPNPNPNQESTSALRQSGQPAKSIGHRSQHVGVHSKGPANQKQQTPTSGATSRHHARFTGN